MIQRSTAMPRERINYEKIQKDIERVYFELQNNIKIRKEFTKAYQDTWKIIKAQKVDKHEEMSQLSAKIGEATFNIDGSIGELNKYMVVHKAFDLAVAQLDEEIKRCVGIIRYSQYVSQEVREGRKIFINTKAETSRDPTLLDDYINKKDNRLKRLLELKEKLSNRMTGTDFSNFVRDNNDRDNHPETIPELRVGQVRNNKNEPQKRISLEDFNKEVFKDFQKRYNPEKEIAKEEKKFEEENKPVKIITDFSKYKNESFKDNSPKNDLIRLKYVPAKSMPSSARICYWRNKFIFNFRKIEDFERCISINDTGANNDCFCSLDFVKQGNIIIEGDKTCQFFEKNAFVNEFVANLIMRCYDLFPVGKVRIHFIDSFENTLYFAFSQILGSVNKGKEPFVSYKSFEICKKYLEEKCNRAFTTSDSNQKDEPYDLVIIRNLPNSEANIETIETLYRMMQNDSKEHQCGIRFVLCEDENKFGGYNSEVSKVITKIKLTSNYHYRILNEDDMFCFYKEGSFVNKKGETIKDNAYNIIYQLQREGNMELSSFVYQKCQNIAEYYLSSKGGERTYEDLQANERADKYNKALTIPIGFAGEEKVSIEFNCGGGANIGLMVIGRTGYGKSTLFNAIIVNGALKYSPEDLSFWLLDFKNNAAAGLYTSLEKDVPHIKLVAHDSKRIDGDIILSHLVKELAVRGQLFNQLGIKTNKKINDVCEYNKIVDSNFKGDKVFKHLPRLILIVDEIQELFREDSSSYDGLSREVADKINQIASKGRYAGIHMAFFAQNLDSTTRVGLLNDAFINQIEYRATYRLDRASVVNSQFGDLFRDNAEKIENLERGEMCLSTKAGIKFVKVVYSDQIFTYCNKIVNKYSNFPSRTLVIGNSEKLSPLNKSARSEQTYLDMIKTPKLIGDSIKFCIGENALRLDPFTIDFTNKADSHVYLIGSDELVYSSIVSSLLIGMKRMKFDFALVSPIVDEKTMLGQLIRSDGYIKQRCHNLKEITESIDKAYNLFANRKNSDKNNESPFFLILNKMELSDNLDGRKSFSSPKSSAFKSSDEWDSAYSDDYNSNPWGSEQSNNIEEESLSPLEKLEAIANQGWAYQVFLIVTLNSKNFREFDDSIQATNNLIVFNDLNYNGLINHKITQALQDVRGSDSGSLVSIMEDISDERSKGFGNESFAFKLKKDNLEKFRPVLFNANEIGGLDLQYIISQIKE